MLGPSEYFQILEYCWFLPMHLLFSFSRQSLETEKLTAEKLLKILMEALSTVSLHCGAAMYTCASCDLHRGTCLVGRGCWNPALLLSEPFTLAWGYSHLFGGRGDVAKFPTQGGSFLSFIHPDEHLSPITWRHLWCQEAPFLGDQHQAVGNLRRFKRRRRKETTALPWFRADSEYLEVGKNSKGKHNLSANVIQ